MIGAVDIALRASLVVSVALLAAVALRGRSAALRHWVLAAGILSAIAVAPLGRALPSWDVPGEQYRLSDRAMATLKSAPADQAIGQAAPTRGTPRVSAAPARIPIALMVNLAWALGFLIAFVPTLWSLARLASVTRRATGVTERRWIEWKEALRSRLNVRANVALLKLDGRGMVGTWGWRRPRVLLPFDCESWTDERIRIVLGHELAHIRRADWSIQIAADFVRAVFWYNPLFWIACRRLRRESEQACDDAVLDAGVPAAEYASHLLEIARASRAPLGNAAVVPIARPSTLEWRIAAMLNNTLPRRRPTRRALTLLFAVIVGVTLAASSFRADTNVQPMPLTGTLYDMTGAVLPQVALTLDDSKGLKRSATTDRNGRFDFGVTDPGRYLLAATLMGFLPISQDMNLQDARNWDRTITLQVGTLQETIQVTDQRPAGAPTHANVEARIGGNLRPPMKTVDVRPIYPQAMRDAGLEGVVPLGALIGADGSVESVRVLGAQGHPELAKAAVEAVRQWRFTPTLLNRVPVEVYMTVTVRFSLED
jgi:TonB family protein